MESFCSEHALYGSVTEDREKEGETRLKRKSRRVRWWRKEWEINTRWSGEEEKEATNWEKYDIIFFILSQFLWYSCLYSAKWILPDSPLGGVHPIAKSVLWTYI